MAITKVTRTLLSTGIVDNSNATAITIDSSENVGIGRTPTAYGSFKVLDLAGSSGAIQKLIHTGSTVELQSYASSTVGAVGTATSHPLLFTTGDTERMRIDSSGMLLVNTTSSWGGETTPHIESRGDVAGDYTGLIVSNTNDAAGDSVSVNFGLARDGGLVFGNAGKITVGKEQDWTSTPSTIDSFMSFSTYLNESLTEKMRIDSSGNVGIGQTSPYNLSVFSSLSLGGTSGKGGLIQLKHSDNSAKGYLYAQGTAVALESVDTNIIRFVTNGAERARLDTSGRLMINQTAASAASAGVKMQVNTDILSRGSVAGYFWENRSGITITSLGGWGGWYSTGTASHFLYSDGSNIVSINRSSGAYTALSDRNKKKDFEDSTVGLAEVMQLQPKKFRMLDDADDAPKKLGFVAQDVENVIPEAYVEDTNEDASGVENTFIGLTDRPIIAALTKAIQEQQTIIDDLKTRIETLENA